jgi:hypothetical protein
MRFFQQWEGNMGLESLLDRQFNAGSTPPLPTRGETILVMVPFLTLFTLSAPQLLVLSGAVTWESQVISILQVVIGIAVVLLLLGGLIYAWRVNWPRWSASWYFFFSLLFIGPLIYLSTIYEDVSLAADTFSEFAAFLLIPLVIALLLYWVTRLDPIKGLLAVLPVVLLIWMPNMEFVPDQIEVPITMLSLVIAAVGAAAIIRLGDWRISLWLAILVAGLVGLLYSYAGIYHGGSLPHSAPAPGLLEVLKNFIPQFLAAATIILGPFLAVSFRSIGRHSGLTGRISYHLALIGVFVILACALANFFQLSDSRVQELRGSTNLWLNELFLFGLLCYLVAVVILGGAYLRKRPVRGWLEYALLALLTLLLPAILMMPVMQIFITYFDAINSFAWIYSFPLVFNTLIGLAWLLLAGWLVTHHNQQNTSPTNLQLL